MQIEKVVIKTCSGFFSFQDSYVDKLTIALDSLAYEVKPGMVLSEVQRNRWSYKTTNPAYAEWRCGLYEIIDSIVHSEDEVIYCDAGWVEFRIIHSDKTKLCKSFNVPPSHFEELFREIGRMIPPWEVCYMVGQSPVD